tara:strand:+ start:42 stop:485 length:444 start_codon:yes stop_codon:yes gene_type:complete
MEKKIDELISLIEEQNKAWSIHLEMLQGLIKVIDSKVNAKENLLKEHPTVREPTEVEFKQPLNSYGDTKPYGVDIEEQKRSPQRSFDGAPPRQQAPVAKPQPEPRPEPSGERVVSLEKPKQDTAQPRRPAPQSKAEMMEQQVNLPNS